MLLLTTCEERERSNPVDSLTELDPDDWAPTNLNTLRLSSNEILLTWEYDRDDISGFKLDRKINNNDWVLEYAVMEQELREWTDTLAFASDTLSYYYRLYAYAGSNVSSYDEVMFNDNAPQPVELYPIVYENGSFIITWSQNNDDDFHSYALYESTSEDMSGQTEVFTSENNTETSYTVTGVSEDEIRYYQIVVTDIFNLETSSSIIIGNSHVPSGVIVFQSRRDGNNEIYIMNVDGSNQTNLTNNSIHDYYPQFSPDGLTIIFNSQVEGTNGVIYTMNLDGTNKVRLTNNGWESSPRFSPDGSKIVFVLPESGNNWSSEIYIMNSDGSNQTRLTDNDGDDNSPQFSPDGSKIVLKTTIIDNDSTYREIYLIDVDGSNQTRLTYHSTVVHDYYPQFSPDGSKIVFVSHLSGNNHEIYIMNIDGSNQTNLTNNIDKDTSPQFSPDGSKIVFLSDRDGNWEIYIMDVDGSNQTNLTNDSGYDSSPQFQPQP